MPVVIRKRKNTTSPSNQKDNVKIRKRTTPNKREYGTGGISSMQKEKVFVAEYVKDFNATQAAIRAGYRESAAPWTGHLLMKKKRVLDMIEEAVAKVEKKACVDSVWVLHNLKKVAERCMQGEPVMVQVDKKWVESGVWKFDSAGANRSLELIGKHLQMFVEKMKIDHSNTDGTLKDIMPNMDPKKAALLYSQMLKGLSTRK